MRKALAVAAVVFIAACSTNPVTGKREFNLVSEADELQMGAQGHQQALQEFGVYNEKPELNAMVDRIGRRIAAVSDRPNLPWHFTLLDSPIVNAMALPGGYVYVTRGIAERMNSEDELAGVIAHEVSHVAARHAARSISQQQLASLGMVVGSVLAGPAATDAVGGLVQLGAGLLFTRYSRQQESQADLLGTAYMTEAGFNPRGAENMLLALERLDTGDTSALEQYFIDHPDPRKRVGDVRKEIATLESKNPQIDKAPMERPSFVRSLDGVITGASTQQTTIRSNTVYNRTYGIIATAPRGWIATTQPGAVFAFTPATRANEGLIVQEVPVQAMQGYANAQVAIRTQLQNMGLRYVSSGSASTQNGQRFAVDLWAGQTSNGQVAVESTQFVEGSNAVVFLQIGPANTRRVDLVSMLGSMEFNRARARSAEPPRMHIATSRAGDTWAELARRATGKAEDAEAVAKINGFDFPSVVPAGIVVKLPEEVVKGAS